MGCHSKYRYRISRRLSAAAAPVLAGVAVAVSFAPQAMASPANPAAAAQRTTVTDILGRVGQTPQLLSDSQRLVGRQAAKDTTYTVRPGDTLSAIAERVYHDQAAWTVLYWANRHQIRWANDITAGQVLKVPAKPARLPGPPAADEPAAIATVASSTVASSAGADEVSTVANSSYSGDGGFTSCVIAAESGGNSQVMNASGHYGLYQFSASTWAAYGGNPGEFGDATVAEQNAVFDTALADGGQSNWSAYDGC